MSYFLKAKTLYCFLTLIKVNQNLKIMLGAKEFRDFFNSTSFFIHEKY